MPGCAERSGTSCRTTTEFGEDQGFIEMRVLFLVGHGRRGWSTALDFTASLRGGRAVRHSFKTEPNVTGNRVPAVEGTH